MDTEHKVNLYHGALMQLLLIIEGDSAAVNRAVLRATMKAYIEGILGQVPKQN